VGEYIIYLYALTSSPPWMARVPAKAGGFGVSEYYSLLL